MHVEYKADSPEDLLQTALESIGMRAEDMLAWLHDESVRYEPDRTDKTNWVQVDRSQERLEELARLFDSIDRLMTELTTPFILSRG